MLRRKKKYVFFLFEKKVRLMRVFLLTVSVVFSKATVFDLVHDHSFVSDMQLQPFISDGYLLSLMKILFIFFYLHSFFLRRTNRYHNNNVNSEGKQNGLYNFVLYERNGKKSDFELVTMVTHIIII